MSIEKVIGVGGTVLFVAAVMYGTTGVFVVLMLLLLGIAALILMSRNEDRERKPAKTVAAKPTGGRTPAMEAARLELERRAKEESRSRD